METITQNYQSSLKDQINIFLDDLQKYMEDEPDTNPSIDGQNQFSNDDANVCYNFNCKDINLFSISQDNYGQVIDNQLLNVQNGVLNYQKEHLENDVKPVILQQQQEEENYDNEDKNKKESLQILTGAFNQRKQLNLKSYNRYIQKKTEYYQKFTSSFINVQQKASKSLSQTEIFGKQLIKYLKQVKQAYKNLNKDLNKITFNFNDFSDNSLWGKVIPDGFKMIIQHNNMSIQTSKTFSQWIELSCLPRIQFVFSSYKDITESQLKQVKSLRQTFLKQEKGCPITQESKIKDFLQEQLKNKRFLQSQKKIIQQWGAASSKLTQITYTKNSQLVNILKSQINNLMDHLKLINKQSHSLFQADIYWNSLQSSQQSMFDRILNQWKIMEVEYDSLINTKRNITMKDVNQFFITINQQQKVGNLNKILRSLYIKSYKTMVECEKNEYKLVQVYLSIDNNLIISDQNSFIKNFMNVFETQYDVEDICIQLREKQKGLFTKWNKQKLKFNCVNQLQEFTMLIDSMKELK